MKNYLVCLLLILSTLYAHAQSTWTWLQGDAYTPGYTIYGIKGRSDTLNRPAGRSGQVTWQDAAGNIWMFGGTGRTANGDGYMNDLWRYSPATNQWTWMNGDPVPNQTGRYGTRGVASSRNNIRARAFATGWTDTAGNLWLYGGLGFEPSLPVSLPAYFNDLWKYSPSLNQWTWMGGDTTYFGKTGYNAVYGTKGVASGAAKPSSKASATPWIDAAGDLWMFGGTGINGGGSGDMNDLWKYTVSTGFWTWIGGDTAVNQGGDLGTQGVPSVTSRPGPTAGASGWIDPTGNLWLFGGQNTLPSSGPGPSTHYSNVLWKYSPVTGLWTWVLGGPKGGGTGVIGMPTYPGALTAYSTPGERSNAVTWTDTAGQLYLYGGSNTARYNDLWKYNPVQNGWTWINGDSVARNRPAVYGQKEMPSGSTHPGSGNFTGSWTDTAGLFWLASTDTMWTYSAGSNLWTWMRGDTAVPAPYDATPKSIYGVPGVAAPGNRPSARRLGATWRDGSGNQWLYGGEASTSTWYTASTAYSDLWRYTAATNQWTWAGGDSIPNKAPVYGTQNVSAPANTPGALSGAATWIDALGNLWLFGGTPAPSFGTTLPKGDLWKYSPLSGEWTWMATYNEGVYAVIPGVSTGPVHPGARAGATTWTDAAGIFWLYGGEGNASSLQYRDFGKLNDLWKYNPATGIWTFVSGDSHTFNPYSQSRAGVYGTKGVPNAGNKPGGRTGAVGWMDPAGDFWIFGGSTDVAQKEFYLNDLWRFSPPSGQWTWMGGDNIVNTKGIYGVQGVAAAGIQPGSRKDATGWADKAGNLFLAAGMSDSTNPQTGAVYTRYWNDTWRYSVGTGQWAWLSGDSAANWPGYYGTQGFSSALNKPGARYGAMSWTDTAGKAWLFGGYGTPINGMRYLNDLLLFSSSSALPVRFSSFTAQREAETVQLRWTTAQEENSRSFTIERSGDGRMFFMIGSVDAAGNSSTPRNYDFTDLKPAEGDNYYRIREADRDGKSQLSPVQKVRVLRNTASFSLLTNPVHGDIALHINLPVNQPVLVQVMNAAGRTVLTTQQQGTQGSNLLTIPSGNLAPGTYFLRLTSASLLGTRKFIRL